jgi:AcrR family transcriptional regulator
MAAIDKHAAAEVEADVGPARERILSNAERVFGAHGFDGASIRQIAEAANAPVALIGYHFGSKAGLYRAVFERRAPAIVEQRLAGLAIAMSEPDLDRRLDLVVKALVLPYLRLRAREGDPSFGRLLARESTDPESEKRGILRDMFDPIALAVIDALQSALPDRPREDIWWSYNFMLASLVFVMAENARLERLSEGVCRVSDENAAALHMIAFLTAGLRHGSPPRAGASAKRAERRSSVVKAAEENAAGPASKGRRATTRRRPD